MRNRRNVEFAELEIRTSADILEEFRREYEAASIQRAPRTSRGDSTPTKVTGRADTDVRVDTSTGVLRRWRVGRKEAVIKENTGTESSRGSLSKHFHRLDMCN